MPASALGRTATHNKRARRAALLVLHAYGGDLFATARSNWDLETHEEIPYDWEKVRSK
jgi:hypothetical protein